MEKKKTFFSSISTKLVMLIVICIFVLAVSLLAICVLLTGRILTRNAATQMNLFCEERGDDLDTDLLRIEDAVGSLSKWTGNKIPDVKTISEDKALRDYIVKEADDLIRYMTEHNEFIQGAYIHYTLDVTGVTSNEEGVYYTRDENGKFKIIPFAQEEIEKDPVAEYWYYGPIRSKKAVWTKPYYDLSVEDYLISYIEPVFVEDTPVAIIGIDISFTRLLKWIATFKYNETGYMYLKEADGSAHYHLDDLVAGKMHSDSEDHVVDNEELMTAETTGDSLIRYFFHDTDRVMVFVTLRNGMKFVLCDSYSEIFNERDRAALLMGLVSVGLTIAGAAVAAVMASRITNPLTKLTSAAEQISTGNYDVVLPPENGDEVGDLSKAFRIAIDKIRARAEDNRMRMAQNAMEMKKQKSDLVIMRDLAYIDSLTKVKNKTAYEDTIGFIDDQIRSGTAEFAVVMCDLNFLKRINDSLGHQAGDNAIKKAAGILCQAFPMSTVFRIGGDEFVVLPGGVDYAKMNEKLETLRILLEQQNGASDEADRISLAVGSAVYDREKDNSYKAVFERADKLMYEHKQQIHKQEGYTGRN
ncbi:MAG: diguanylate cyclase [Clostridiales bacterium]|nr:diguanylate cyclase [Clostridiales bacterium]